MCDATSDIELRGREMMTHTANVREERKLAVELLQDRITPTMCTDEGIFGHDNRIPIPAEQLNNPVNELGAVQPFAAVGLVSIDRDLDGDRDGTGTAFLIGPNYALTAAHGVDTLDEQGAIRPLQPNRISIFFGWDGYTAHTGVVGVEEVRLMEGWTTSGGTDRRSDVALLRLDQNIGSKTGNIWFNLLSDGTRTAAGERLESVGHPCDSPTPFDPRARNRPQVITSGPSAGVGNV